MNQEQGMSLCSVPWLVSAVKWHVRQDLHPHKPDLEFGAFLSRATHVLKLDGITGFAPARMPWQGIMLAVKHHIPKIGLAALSSGIARTRFVRRVQEQTPE